MRMSHRKPIRVVWRRRSASGRRARSGPGFFLDTARPLESLPGDIDPGHLRAPRRKHPREMPFPAPGIQGAETCNFPELIQESRRDRIGLVPPCNDVHIDVCVLIVCIGLEIHRRTPRNRPVHTHRCSASSVFLNWPEASGVLSTSLSSIITVWATHPVKNSSLCRWSRT